MCYFLYADYHNSKFPQDQTQNNNFCTEGTLNVYIWGETVIYWFYIHIGDFWLQKKNHLLSKFFSNLVCLWVPVQGIHNTSRGSLQYLLGMATDTKGQVKDYLEWKCEAVGSSARVNCISTFYSGFSMELISVFVIMKFKTPILKSQPLTSKIKLSWKYE